MPEPGQSPLPVQHVGLTVSDLDTSIRWYETVLGTSAGQVASNEGPSLARALRLGDDVELRFAFFDLGNVLLELVAYDRPSGRTSAGRSCDVGAAHVCFEVDDIDAVSERMGRAGVEFSSSPITIDRGNMRGARFVYFTDPDGIQLQLMELPTNLALKRT